MSDWLLLLVFFLVLLAFCLGVLFLAGWIVVKRYEKSKHNVACPNCKTKGRVAIDENLLGERVHALRCKKCGSLSVCRAGLHWNMVMQNNTKKEAKENG